MTLKKLCASVGKSLSKFRRRMSSQSRIATGILVTTLIGASLITIVILMTVHFGDSCIAIGIPTGLAFKSYSNVTRISWKAPEDLGNCVATYRLIYRIDGHEPITVDTEEEFYEIPRIYACSTIAVTLWAVSAHSAEMSEDNIFLQYTELPNEIPPPFGRSMLTKDGLEISWLKPDPLKVCRIHYSLQIETDFGHKRTHEVFASNHLVDDSTFCFVIRYRIATVYENQRGTYRDHKFVADMPVRDMQIKKVIDENSMRLQVSWEDHPKQVLCSLEYTVVYELQDRPSKVISVLKPEVALDFLYCVHANVTVSIAYGNTTCNATLPATTWPDDLGKITDLEVSTPGPNRKVTWAMEEKLNSCKLSYTFRFSTDVRKSKYTLTDTFVKYFNIPKMDYCFKLQVELEATLRGARTKNSTEEYQFNVDAPRDLTLEPYPNTNRLLATWKDDKHVLCTISYNLTYEHGGSINNCGLVKRPRKWLKFYYCTTAKATVRGVHRDTEDSDAIDKTHTEGYPPSVGPVQDIDIEVSHIKVTATWALPDNAHWCLNITHQVIGVNTANPNITANCTGYQECVMKMSDVCPSTNFTFIPFSHPGVSESYIHNC